MVRSGLVDQPDVSHYRLAVHLGLAVVIFGLLLWAALTSLFGDDRDDGPVWRHHRGAMVCLAAVFATILSGALVAGLDAGFAYNTFPTMNGMWIPEGILAGIPWYTNFTENTITVQFGHRWLAISTAAAILILWWRERSRAHGGFPRMALQRHGRCGSPPDRPRRRDRGAGCPSARRGRASGRRHDIVWCNGYRSIRASAFHGPEVGGRHMTFCSVYITASDKDEAVGIGKALVEERLAACANVIDGVRSLYWWDGEVQDDPEVVVILKSRTELMEALTSRVKELHSYDVPLCRFVADPGRKRRLPELAWRGDGTPRRGDAGLDHVHAGLPGLGPRVTMLMGFACRMPPRAPTRACGALWPVRASCAIMRAR